MNEKKKALIMLIVLAVSLLVILGAISQSLLESNKKVQDVKMVFERDKTQIIYLAKDSCYYCNLLEPITNSLKEEFKLEYYKIDTSALTTSELNRILKVLDIDYDTFGTPYIVITRDGEKIGEHVGYTDENVLFDLFQKHGLIDEDESLHMIYLEEIDPIFESSDKSLVLIGETGDANSIASRETLRKLAKENTFEIKYFDTAKLTDEDDYSILLEKLEVEELPVLVEIENGKVVSKETQKKYKEYLKDKGYIE